MTIQKKLVILLLSIALIPLLAVVLLYQTTIFLATSRVSDDILSTLDENARYNLQRMLNDYDQKLRLNVQLLENILQLQAIAVEDVLGTDSRHADISNRGIFGHFKELGLQQTFLSDLHIHYDLF